MATNITGNSSNTITWSGSTRTFVLMIARQYSGVTGIDVTGSGASANGSGITLTSPSLTATNANEGIFAAGTGYGATGWMAGKGYGNLIYDSLFPAATEDRIVSSVQTGLTKGATSMFIYLFLLLWAQVLFRQLPGAAKLSCSTWARER